MITKEEARLKVKELLYNYKKHEEAIKDLQEAQIENNFIRPLFEAINWNTKNTQLSVNNYEFIIQRTDAKGKRPDYILQLDNQHLLIMDAKRFKHNIDDHKLLYQIYSYAFSTQNQSLYKKIDFAILTDFHTIIVLDCTVFVKNQKMLKSLIIKKWVLTNHITEDDILLSLEEYINKKEDKLFDSFFSEFWDLFEKENLRIAAKSRTECPIGLWSLFQPYKKKIPPDEAFLNDLDNSKTGWRICIAKDMKKNNPDVDGHIITAAVQLLIDRLLFVKSLSDREIEDDYLEQIATISKRTGLSDTDTTWFNACKSIFEQLRIFYNGNVFDNRKELDIVTVSNKLIVKIISELKSDSSPYNFATMPVEILGIIYERFLGSIVTTTDKQVKITNKNEKNQKGGVYYTPQYIAEHILNNTLGKILSNCKIPDDVSKIKILDPACGSGSFLLVAYSMIISWYLNYYNSEGITIKDRSFAYKGIGGKIFLTAKLKRQILLNNIYGVDIDEQAVEVSCFSLSLKALEDTKKDELIEEFTLFKQTILPDLSNNIKCGNSLMGYDFNNILLTEVNKVENMNKYKLFDWKGENGFPEIMNNGKFDVVVGNPPYYSVETWGANNPQTEYFKEKYSEIWQDKSDILNYFVYQSSKLSKQYVSFIIKNAFLYGDKSQKLRNFIVEKYPFNAIVNFEKYKVFYKSDVTTAIVLWDKMGIYKTAKVLNIQEKNVSIDYIQKKMIDGYDFTIELRSNQVFALVNSQIEKLNNKIDDKHKRLGEIVELGSGMQTGTNKVYHFDEYPTKFSDKFIKKHITNEYIQRYYINSKTGYILYFEKNDEFDKLPQKLQHYLEENKQVLKDRADKKRRKTAKWWNYTFPMHQEFYNLNKIWCSFRDVRNNFSYDDTKEYVGLTNTAVIFDTNPDVDLRYLLALLNSRLLTFRYRSIGKQTGGGMFEYLENSISKIPIPIIDKEKQKPFIILVVQMIELQKKYHIENNKGNKQNYKDSIYKVDKQIDKLVYTLYGIDSKEDIDLIETNVLEAEIK